MAQLDPGPGLPRCARWAPCRARHYVFNRENVLNENFERSTRISTRRGRSQARRQRVDSIQTFEERFSSPPKYAGQRGGGSDVHVSRAADDSVMHLSLLWGLRHGRQLQLDRRLDWVVLRWAHRDVVPLQRHATPGHSGRRRAGPRVR